jgi:hypothetical protein
MMPLKTTSPLKNLQLVLVVSEAIIFITGLLLSQLFGFSMLLTFIPMIIFFFVFLHGIVSYCRKHNIVDETLMGDGE